MIETSYHRVEGNLRHLESAHDPCQNQLYIIPDQFVQPALKVF